MYKINKPHKQFRNQLLKAHRMELSELDLQSRDQVWRKIDTEIVEQLEEQLEHLINELSWNLCET
jgi:hypothetical protein